MAWMLGTELRRAAAWRSAEKTRVGNTASGLYGEKIAALRGEKNLEPRAATDRDKMGPKVPWESSRA